MFNLQSEKKCIERWTTFMKFTFNTLQQIFPFSIQISVFHPDIQYMHVQIMSNNTVTFKLFCSEFSDIAVDTFIYIYTYFYFCTSKWSVVSKSMLFMLKFSFRCTQSVYSFSKQQNESKFIVVLSIFN